MDSPAQPSADISLLACSILGSPDVIVEGSSTGNVNDAWRVSDAGGAQYVMKVGPADRSAKWRSAHHALAIAGAAGLPVPKLVHSGEHRGRLVRVFTWIDGVSADAAVLDDQQQARLIASVGAAVAELHRIAFERFSSRADGSAPAFERWSRYLSYRLSQIRQRCEATGVLPPAVLDRACARVATLAVAIDDVAEPVLCHRDLHPGNLIVRPDGTLAGIVDWDAAEPWDRAGDWFKLEHELLRTMPSRADDLLAAYLHAGPVPPRWDERRQVVHLIETLNTLPNVVTQGWEPEFADRARRNLDALLAAGGGERSWGGW